MKVLGYCIVNKSIVDSDSKVCSGSSYLEFLLQHKPDTIRMLYHLDHNVDELLAMLNLSYNEVGSLIKSTMLHTGPYHLRYIPSKLFSIKRSGAFAYVADAHRYAQYPDED